eukprot:1132406-Pleurochrysis_carterae.AAC.2
MAVALSSDSLPVSLILAPFLPRPLFSPPSSRRTSRGYGVAALWARRSCDAFSINFVACRVPAREGSSPTQTLKETDVPVEN